MKDRIFIGAAFLMATGPALAGTVADSIRVPEPATITLFGTAVAGAYIVRKIKGRK
jgi:hypothetical protein